MSKRVGYAPEVYDLFHIRHLNLLRHARAHCDHLIAGVASDETASRITGSAPVVPLAERLEIVRSMRFVDEAVVITTTDELANWQRVRFDVIFTSDDDGRPAEEWSRLERDFAGVGVEVVRLPHTVHPSSAQLRRVLSRPAAP